MFTILRSPLPHYTSTHLRRGFIRGMSSNSTDISASAAIPESLDRYRDAFARRMKMAGIKPHHRIALGVSGGADSMALCILAKEWKCRSGGEGKKIGFCEGILGVVVDHKLRPESTDEAHLVSARLEKIGIRCEVVGCDWSDGQPKLGHLEEAARDKRYAIFQGVCIRHQIGVLLVGHHADDQAELFILRLSRNSGVLGLAGMAFVSQLFLDMDCSTQNSRNNWILLVRPMLEFCKDDMYKICEMSHQEWVEDPSNQCAVFARNRIRLSLRNYSGLFKSELHTLISACRLTRSFIEHACVKMMERSVTINDKYGYAIIDMKVLSPSFVEDLCLTKFLGYVLQFIAQRHRAIRGKVSQMLMDYIRNIPCKTAFTAAGCYLCAVPGSKGMKVLVCSSPDCPDVSETTITHTHNNKEHHPNFVREAIEIITNAKSYTDNKISSSVVPFLHVKSFINALEEAKKLNLISESTHKSIVSLQVEETKLFHTQAEVKPNQHVQPKITSPFISGIPLCSRQTCHFMRRFIVSWKFVGMITQDRYSSYSGGITWNAKRVQTSVCESCTSMQKEFIASVRLMVDADWLYLANLVHIKTCIEYDEKLSFPVHICTAHEHTYKSAQNAIKMLKSIPLAARRALPVLVDSEGLLLSIPSIGFNRCPFLSTQAVFCPRVPLGGGFSSYS